MFGAIGVVNCMTDDVSCGAKVFRSALNLGVDAKVRPEFNLNPEDLKVSCQGFRVSLSFL